LEHLRDSALDSPSGLRGAGSQFLGLRLIRTEQEKEGQGEDPKDRGKRGERPAPDVNLLPYRVMSSKMCRAQSWGIPEKKGSRNSWG